MKTLTSAKPQTVATTPSIHDIEGFFKQRQLISISTGWNLTHTNKRAALSKASTSIPGIQVCMLPSDMTEFKRVTVTKK